MPKKPPRGLNGLSADDQGLLATFVQTIETLREEMRPYQEALRDTLADARDAGFDTRTINRIIRERAIDEDARRQAEQLYETYRHALGMLADTPLGRAAMEQEPKPAPKPRASRQPTPPRTPRPFPDPDLAGEAAADMASLREAASEER
jgi:uncharacterized protein (UPF0335 family)